MRALVITVTFIGAYNLVDSLSPLWATILGLTVVAGLFAGAVALGVKWVRNV